MDDSEFDPMISFKKVVKKMVIPQPIGANVGEDETVQNSRVPIHLSRGDSMTLGIDGPTDLLEEREGDVNIFH